MENAPISKLRFLQRRLALSEAELEVLKPFREFFVSGKEEFADYFYSVFSGIPETKYIIERLENPGLMKKIWARWFEALFGRDRLDDDFLAYLWRIGGRHVDVGLDQRFTNLGFSVARQFCHGMVISGVPEGKRADLLVALDKLLDLCLLVETSAYIAATTRCDLELINGIADKIRNKITIIGGNIRMLKRKAEPSSPAYEVYEALLMESRMCENMVRDINVYNDVFQRETEYQDVSLEDAVRRAVEHIKPEENFKGVGLEVAISPDASHVHADPRDVRKLLVYALENAFEAAEGEAPRVRVSSGRECTPSEFVCIEIFNTGTPPKPEAVEKFFSPFYSTKAEGSGFGVPIATLAAKKNFGTLAIVPAGAEGTTVKVTLPAAAGQPGP
ncbi:MAG: protoglobin domain-containing protein [Nitrospirota bacterium]|jgi:signal transduction histidine kinase